MSSRPESSIPRMLRHVVNVLLCVLPLLLATCSENDPVAPTTPYADTEQQVWDLVNRHRAGLNPTVAILAMHDVITREARKHSEEMAANKSPFNHDGFQARIMAISAVLAVERGGENIAMNRGFPDPGAQAMTGWLNSPPHRANIEGEYTHTGVGVAKSADGSVFFTQIFIKVR